MENLEGGCLLKIELKVLQVVSLAEIGMVKMLLLRRGLKDRITPLLQSEEQKIAQVIIGQVSHFGGPPEILLGRGPFPQPQWDARIDMEITNEEYEELGKPGINDTILIEVSIQT